MFPFGASTYQNKRKTSNVMTKFSASWLVDTQKNNSDKVLSGFFEIVVTSGFAWSAS